MFVNRGTALLEVRPVADDGGAIFTGSGAIPLITFAILTMVCWSTLEALDVSVSMSCACPAPDGDLPRCFFVAMVGSFWLLV